MSTKPLSKRFVQLAVSIPIFVIAASIALSQWNHDQGRRWEFPLQAYDPRDILRGKYLNVRFGHETSRENCDDQRCCVCWEDIDPESKLPKIKARPCNDAKRECKEYLEADALDKSYRYFIPEARSRDIEDTVIEAARENRARVEFVLDRKKRPQITEIRIDGEPLGSPPD